MDTSVFDRIASAASYLKLGINSQEIAQLADKEQFTEDQLDSVCKVMQYLEDRKHTTAIDTLLRLSRLPVKAPRTFQNYDFSQIHGKDTDQLKNLSTLSEIYAGKNIALIGPTGVGKTHLAEAYGWACCKSGFKTYFLKASELNDRFLNARKASRESSVIAGLVKPSCLIIDEIGKGTFDEKNTLMFFDMVDRRYQKEGPQTMIFTSNVQPNMWYQYFTGTDDILCSIDRIFDCAKIINIKGNSYRGRKREVFAVEAGTPATN